MNFLKYYFDNTILYDLLNKFNYKTIYSLPKLIKIILNFNYNNFNSKILMTNFFFIKLVTTQQGLFSISKKPNIILKIKKGLPINCKIILKNYLMYLFFSKLIFEIFNNLKVSNGFKIKKKKKEFNFSVITFSLSNNLNFLESKPNYSIFYKASSLNIIFITNKIKKEEFFFFFYSLKLIT